MRALNLPLSRHRTRMLGVLGVLLLLSWLLAAVAGLSLMATAPVLAAVGRATLRQNAAGAGAARTH